MVPLGGLDPVAGRVRPIAGLEEEEEEEHSLSVKSTPLLMPIPIGNALLVNVVF